MKSSKLIIYITIFFIHFNKNIKCEKVAIIGSNYVGLVTSHILSNFGHEVLSIDIDQEKIEQLQKQKLTIHEPKLNEIFDKENKVKFTTDITQAEGYPIIYLCVGTPTNTWGECDLSAIYGAINQILKLNTKPKVLCIKSTVQPGTLKNIKNYLSSQQNDDIELVYNPEFMREGSAVDDILTKNPIIIGGSSEEGKSIIERLYTPILESNNIKLIKTSYETAEIIKYAWNSFSAIRIAYINELALLSNEYLADIFTIIKGISLSEELLPTANIKPGPGYGGSCFPKDTKAFAKLAEKNKLKDSLVNQAIQSNKRHIKNIKKLIYSAFPSGVKSKTITILGLSFKANTDDVRYSPAIKFIKSLKKHGAIINAYDPKANKNMQHIFPDINYFECPYEACKNSNGIIATTEWEEIGSLNFDIIKSLCSEKILIDPRNIFDPKTIKDKGFKLLNLGRQ